MNENMLKCNRCGHEQVYVNHASVTKYDKRKKEMLCLIYGNWVPVIKQTCHKCQCEDLNKDFTTVQLDDTLDVRNPNSVKHWKHGKSTEHIAAVISGDIDPY